jgi:hypothetical protein
MDSFSSLISHKKGDIDKVLMSVLSEGHKPQCVRDELYAVFGVWVPWQEEHRALGRELMLQHLQDDGLILEMKTYTDGRETCSIAWRGVFVERKRERLWDARNAMVSALRQVLHPLGRWPIAARPSTDPHILHAD